ncbi:unnamed protein product [Medioppia subpectinata]|uniref:Neurotransmitter-gated ion-channel ligand-binding domain-containing protein n=1 Tax=Medioppia subpectinata TaxID=1979941 RepID=A0A7R9PWE8_9ACAR|nr:unnamed protein product [Medioppia subpectinata]CAG2103862.1 unnamed protein product [Medioppia subpectinata]
MQRHYSGNDSDHKEDNKTTDSEIILSGYHSEPQRLMSHKMHKTPENTRQRSGSTDQLESLEISKKVTIILGDLLVDYDRNQRPGHGGPEAVITTNLEIRSIGPISELDMEFSLDCYFRQKWLDKRLEFSGPSKFLSLNINIEKKKAFLFTQQKH